LCNGECLTEADTKGPIEGKKEGALQEGEKIAVIIVNPEGKGGGGRQHRKDNQQQQDWKRIGPGWLSTAKWASLSKNEHGKGDRMKTKSTCT